MDHVFAKFASAIFLLNLLLRLHRNGHKTTSGVKSDFKFDFSVPDFLYIEKF